MEYVVLIIELAIFVLVIVSLYMVFEKAGEPGWAALVPIYNLVVLCRISGKPGIWVLLMLIPLVGLIFYVMAIVSLSERFGHGGGYAAGLILLPFIFYPMLAFGPDQYDGPRRGRKKRKKRDRDRDEDRPPRKLESRDDDRPRRRRADPDDDDEDDDERPRRRREPDDEDDEPPPRPRRPPPLPK